MESNVHAPTEDAGEEDKDAFYETLENKYERLPQHDIKIMLDNCNAKLER